MFLACDDNPSPGHAGATDRPVVSMGSKGRLYPNRKQAAIMARIAGQTRWLWNHWLAESVKAYRRDGRFIVR